MEHNEIDRLLRQNGLNVPADRLELLRRYVEELLRWNQRVNLISRRDEENIWSSHILHSIAPLLLFHIPEGIRALDLGSGGGLPGIPLSLVHGKIDIVLIDSIQKKIGAVHSIIRNLHLPGLAAVAGRAEELGGHKEHSGQYDLVLARGVAPLHELVRWARPFLARRGLPPMRLRHAMPHRKDEFHFPYLLAYKGGDLDAELKKAQLRSEGISITEISIHFNGSDQLGLVAKKLVVVEFR